MITVGVDESGTGAWAGPFTVCALAVRKQDQALLAEMGARDSKEMSDAARRQILPLIVDTAILVHCEVIEVAEMVKRGHRNAWRVAMSTAVQRLVSRLDGSVDVVIDGKPDGPLRSLLKTAGVISPRFLVRAENQVPAVAAASIVAKTIRNDRMLLIDREYPEYGWRSNSGYGSSDHQEALYKYGRTKHHRTHFKNIKLIHDRT